MINKFLDSMIEATKIDGCGVYNTLNFYDGIEDIGCSCDCESCKRESVARIEQLKKTIYKLITDGCVHHETIPFDKTEYENHKKHQNMTIKDLIEVDEIGFYAEVGGNWCEFESLPTDLIGCVYGEKFLNQEIIAIEQKSKGKIYVTVKGE